MKALVYVAIRKKTLEDSPISTITAPTDAIMKVMIIDKIGTGVTRFKPRDKVLILSV